MTAAAWLIAEREFRAYTTVPSFWVALAIAPVAMVIVLLTAGGPSTPPQATLTLVRTADGATEARFSKDFPLSAPDQHQVLQLVAKGGQLSGPLRLAKAEPSREIDAAAISRFALVMMLWMALTGSLGMLLQAVVRERSNRALESLLAAAGPWDIVLGKLVGIGGISLLVVGAWLGSTALLSTLTVGTGGVVLGLLRSLAHPALMARAIGIYVLAFAFYGFLTVGIGARARDNADAQNLARPMFLMLLAVFFTALACALGTQNLDWLVYVPPFTPFMLLMQPKELLIEGPAIASLSIATIAAAMFAVKHLTLNPPSIGYLVRMPI